MIICIGREFGSGGHEIGRILAKKLGLELYDRDLIDKAAEKIVAMPKEVLEKADEKKHNPWLHQVWYDVPNQELNCIRHTVLLSGNWQEKKTVCLSDAVQITYWNRQNLIISACL